MRADEEFNRPVCTVWRSSIERDGDNLSHERERAIAHWCSNVTRAAMRVPVTPYNYRDTAARPIDTCLYVRVMLATRRNLCIAAIRYISSSRWMARCRGEASRVLCHMIDANLRSTAELTAPSNDHKTICSWTAIAMLCENINVEKEVYQKLLEVAFLYSDKLSFSCAVLFDLERHSYRICSKSH